MLTSASRFGIGLPPEAGSGQHLEATLVQFDPQLVLVDQHLHGSTGTELARLIREHDQERDFTRSVVIVSGSPRNDDGPTDAAIDAWLIKPVCRQDLQRLLGSLATTGSPVAWNLMQQPIRPNGWPLPPITLCRQSNNCVISS